MCLCGQPMIAAGEVYITQAYEMGLPLMVTLLSVQQQEGTQDCRLALRDCNSMLCAWANAWVKAPVTLATTKVQCEECSTRFRGYCSSSDTNNWKCFTCSMYRTFKIPILVRFSHTWFLIGH